jgi:hypothetical protein
MDTVYIFNTKQMQLKEIIPIINTGDIIKGINNYMVANAVLSEINRQKNSNHTYLFDGPNQIILF